MKDSANPAPPEAALDPLGFTPVPTLRARHDGWSPRHQGDFILALAAMGNVSRAAKAVGRSATSAYNLRKRPGAESFAEAWDTALDMAYDRNLAAAMDRATNGILVERFYRGKLVSTARRFDYRLALAVLASPTEPRKKVAR
jgi:hypothetical protein